MTVSLPLLAATGFAGSFVSVAPGAAALRAAGTRMNLIAEERTCLVVYAREPSKLLSADEVVRFLEAIPSLKSCTALTTVYAAGLRVSEVVVAQK